MSKIYSASSPDILSNYECKSIEELEADWFVYSYEIGDWSGNGFAVWKKNDEYYYDNLGHCSCYGPVENIRYEIPYSFKEIELISIKYGDHAKNVIDFINKACLYND